ncbi:MAG: EAL domain-containing protein, partial [Pseudomonadota bacterium]
FWAMAEECGMAEMLEGGLAFRSVEAFAALRDAGVNIPTLGINVSPRMMRDANFAADLIATCNMFLIDPADVEIEVLEDVLAQGETGAAYETISALAKAGCRVVVDDFGVGYSSLSTVSMLDIKGLKLDRSLIQKCDDARVLKILTGSIALAKSMGMNVVAEGIETASQYATLKKLGADVCQGFLIGVPTHQDDFADWHTTYSGASQAELG